MQKHRLAATDVFSWCHTYVGQGETPNNDTRLNIRLNGSRAKYRTPPSGIFNKPTLEFSANSFPYRALEPHLIAHAPGSWPRITGPRRVYYIRVRFMNNSLQFRSATEDDSTELALILDVAGRGLPAWGWSQITKKGQSCLELGREQIRTDTSRSLHFENWHVAEFQNKFVGAFYGFSVEDPYPEIDFDTVPECFHPILELEKVASGCWLLQAMAIFPEHRGKGFAGQLLSKAESVAKASGTNRIALQVEEVNKVAFGFYQKNGYVEVDRRPYIPFPGSDDTGDYVLKCKVLA